jgi:hypothetical protein
LLCLICANQPHPGLAFGILEDAAEHLEDRRYPCQFYLVLHIDDVAFEVVPLPPQIIPTSPTVFFIPLHNAVLGPSQMKSPNGPLSSTLSPTRS